MKFNVTSNFYMGEELIQAGTVIDIDKQTIGKCLKAGVGVIAEEGGEENGVDPSDTSNTGTSDPGGDKASPKGRRK